ncbi:MAG: hypothetical protein J0I41_02985 [Filimonas sp.]|nr:hypothetical protein [Filimonas sp.]
MQQLKKWQIAAIVIVVLLNVYTITDGIIYQSVFGILLSIASLGALFLCVKIFKRMNEMEESES